MRFAAFAENGEGALASAGRALAPIRIQGCRALLGEAPLWPARRSHTGYSPAGLAAARTSATTLRQGPPVAIMSPDRMPVFRAVCGVEPLRASSHEIACDPRNLL
jgi:hypothetical protein